MAMRVMIIFNQKGFELKEVILCSGMIPNSDCNMALREDSSKLYNRSCSMHFSPEGYCHQHLSKAIELHKTGIYHDVIS